MIIVVAALEFANQADRDEAVRLTAEVQRLTREEEPGCHDYCFARTRPSPRMQVYGYGKIATVWLRIFSIHTTTAWQAYFRGWALSAACRLLGRAGRTCLHRGRRKKAGFFLG